MVDTTAGKGMTGGTFAIGIDLGATTVKAGVVDHSGTILRQVSADAKGSEGPDAVMRQICGVIGELFTTHPLEGCSGIGIGSPGVVTANDGIVRHPPNFAGWGDVDVAAAIRKVYPITVKVANDANAAAMAEARYGAGKDHKDFLFVIWGTGVGGGVILDGKIFAGPYGGAGEIGHVTVDYRGPRCGCGNPGCIEAYIGQRYLSDRARARVEEAARRGAPSAITTLVGGDLSKIEPVLIARAAEGGDALAREIFREAGELLGVALASVMNVLDLHVAVIGGGISAAPEFVYEAITSSVTERILTPHRAGLKVVRASLGNSAGIIGAAALVL
jgi:glucokinase